MLSARSLLLGLFIMSALPLTTPVHAQALTSFVGQVDTLLRSDWTEIRITQASMGDTGEVNGITLQLSRERPDAPVFYQTGAKSEKKPLTAAQFQSLQSTLLIAAKEVEAIQTPAEILDTLSPTEASKLIAEGKVKQNEVTQLIVACIKPTKTTPLSNEGASPTLSLFLEREFAITTRKLSR